ncbi:hypothetical protein [Desulfofustis limnaeus]|uniref:Uncharacterized protein n=1 Tax=Desulfofustis limnaeus TaxID=2740163 RepID=A0ABN6M757_9BACT|nr:hypothetical protein [Desulfofustis limnaeus]BDD88714.1 hypothetical protein DPPLL_30790 [Desulfofustis limnaeus]
MDKYVPGMMPDQRPTSPRLPPAKPSWMSDEQWERTPPEPEPRPVLDLGTVVVMGVEKGMGLRRGEKVVRLGLIRIVSVRAEQLAAITDADVVAEGFPDKDQEWFIEMFCRHNRVVPGTVVNRIEFEYV